MMKIVWSKDADKKSDRTDFGKDPETRRPSARRVSRIEVVNDGRLTNLRIGCYESPCKSRPSSALRNTIRSKT